VGGERHTLNNRQVLGGVTADSKGIWPYVISFGYADATLKSQAVAYSVSTSSGRVFTNADLSSTSSSSNRKRDGMRFPRELYYTLNHGFGGGGRFLFSAGAGGTFAGRAYMYDIGSYTTAWDLSGADQFAVSLGQIIAAQPYNLDTGNPDEGVVKEGDTISSTATVTVTKA
jgi:hypothetical protein